MPVDQAASGLLRRVFTGFVLLLGVLVASECS